MAYQNKELKGHNKLQHPNGFAVPVGRIKNMEYSGIQLKKSDFLHAGISEGKRFSIEMESGVRLSGLALNFLEKKGLVLGIEVQDYIISLNNNILYRNSGIDLFVTGENVTSVFAGPADIEAFQPSVNVPKEKTHKIVYDSKTLKLHKLYGLVREIREKQCDEYLLYKIIQIVHKYFPDDWLLSLEVLELTETKFPFPKLSSLLRDYLSKLKGRKPELKKLIEDGINLIGK
jgi:phenylalanine-4-hydroxylase